MSFHSLKLEKANSANLWNTDTKGKTKPRNKPLVFLDCISPFPHVFMLDNQCNCEERCGIISRHN